MNEQRDSEKAAMLQSTQGAVPQAGTSRDAMLRSSYPSQTENRILWIDGVGGFLLVERDEVVIGQAISGNQTDIRIVGDVSRRAASIRRSGGDYLLQAFQPSWLDGRSVDRPQLLQDGSQVQLGDCVQLGFNQPNPLSATASLHLTSLNKFKPNVDAVLLLAESCVIGPAAGSHIHCPTWESELLMFRHGDTWFFRTLQSVQVDGKEQVGQIALVPGMRMQGEDFSLSVE